MRRFSARRGAGQVGAEPNDLEIIKQFASPHYQRHNIARLAHLDSIGLVISRRRVLEVGAGIGDHTLFYLYRGCDILPTDGRPDLVRIIEARLGVKAEVLDLDLKPERVQAFGRFDILHCYGLLYHLSQPERFLVHAAQAAEELFLETCVSFGSDQLVCPVPEDRSISTQAAHGVGCRPTRAWVFNTLSRVFPYVYCPRTQPSHEEFPVDWTTHPSDKDSLIRAVFIASHTRLSNPMLLDYVPDAYESSLQARPAYE